MIGCLAADDHDLRTTRSGQDDVGFEHDEGPP